MHQGVQVSLLESNKFMRKRYVEYQQKIQLVNYMAHLHENTVFNWWKSQNCTHFETELLPTTGTVALYADTPVAAGWVYLDQERRLAQLSWLSTAPGAPKVLRYAALELIVHDLTLLSKAYGVRYVSSMCDRAGLNRLLTKRIGFVPMQNPHQLQILPLGR